MREFPFKAGAGPIVVMESLQLARVKNNNAYSPLAHETARPLQ